MTSNEIATSQLLMEMTMQCEGLPEYQTQETNKQMTSETLHVRIQRCLTDATMMDD